MNDEYEQEIRHLNTMVRVLQEREKNLEVQLLEFYGHKEQETAMIELQNRLKINNMESHLFRLKIESLQVDNQRLQAQVSDHAKSIADLDAAKAKIKLLKRALRSEAQQNKEQILTLQKTVNRLQEQELKAAATDSEIQLKLQKLKDLEAEAEDLRESNFRLHLENSELASQLESTQILANSVVENPEREELRELSNRLGQENGDLAKELERLQADRSTDVEELVYLRWVNACLRYELRSFQPLHGKTVERDLSRSLSPETEGKAKQLIFECANTEGKVEKGIDIMDFESDQWSSSNTSCIADSPDRDDPSVSSKNSNWKKVKIFNKLRRLIRGKDVPHRNRGSSTGKNVGTEDSDSSRGSSSISTTTDAATDRQSSSVQNPSLQFCWHSSGKSAGIRRLKSANIDEIKDIEIGRSNHSESSSEHRKCLSGRTASSDFSLKNQLDKHPHPIEKSELLDMAEALNNSKIGTFHRKAASLGSY
ncbi:protein CHUP1, chloroplastic [Manihot esculenta]|nr:protein CHUP1, chloroplastic [Manihot esculenta]